MKAALFAYTAAFSFRIVAQALQYWGPQHFLPPFSSFQGSNLPYWALLASQLLILAIMVRVSWRVQRGALITDRIGAALAWVGGIYLAGSLGRIVVGLGVPSAPEWYRAWIPAVFHVVLAGFVLTLAAYHYQGARKS